MEMTGPSDEVIFLEALTAYADSCTLPELTEHCPFYRMEDGHPTCGEECRRILERNGGASRPVVNTMVNGLRMTGRQIPLRVATGIEEFDATQLWLQERDRPVGEQSTATLLMGLGVSVRRNLAFASTDSSGPVAFWGELLRRGVDVERVFRGGITRGLAETAAARALAEFLTRDGVVDATPILSDAAVRSFPMAELVDAALDETTIDPHVWNDPNLVPLLTVLDFAAQRPTSDERQEILLRRDVQFVISQGFSRRMEEWFSGLASHDLEAALAGMLPSAELFRSTPGRPHGNAAGQWIWERFTVTDPASWAPSSLLMEWQWARGRHTDACDQRVMKERHIPIDQIGLKAMEAFEAADADAQEENLFQPAKYVQLAINHLAMGEWSKAAQIFEGLVELSPGDGEAWNNWGFCLLGEDAAGALARFERGAALQRPVPLISSANQVVALHLLGRDEEALALARDALRTASSEANVSATVWLHPIDDAELELGHTSNTRIYLENLQEHIARRDCAFIGSDLV